MSTETQTQEKIVVALQPPKLWKVVILNDDYTPMDLVIEILTSIFKQNEAQAKETTLEIHNQGSAIVGVYPYEIAEQKGLEATTLARANGSPLKIQVEAE
jgi:ATP-dependent Clp protease adaptor protein ClpS